MMIDAYIRAQPALLARLPERLEPMIRALPALATAPERVILIGTGSSMNALLAAATALEEATGVTPVLKEPEAFLRLPPRRSTLRTLVIAVSQSGRSTTTVAAVRLAGSMGLPTVAVVGEAGTPMAALGADVVVMPIGEETAGPKTKGYTASVLTLLGIAARLGGPPLATASLGAAMEIALTQAEAAARSLLQRYGIPDYIQVTGQLGHVGSALEASLKIAEITGVPTAAFDTEEALHGHVHGTTDRSLVVVIARDPAEAQVAQTLGAALTALGPRLAICNLSEVPTPFDLRIDWPQPSPGWADAAWVLFPFQWYAWHIAKAKGHDIPGMVYPDLGRQLDIKIHGPSAQT
jgi:fructoselysine-6-P-deglycase FrlB-like protein